MKWKLLILAVLIFSMFPSVYAETGVSLRESSLPFLDLYYEDYNYVFELKNHYLKVSPFIIANGTFYDLKQIVSFLKNNYPGIDYKWLVERSLHSFHYGFNLTKLPQKIADSIDFLGFRLTDHSFPLSWIKLYTDPENRTLIGIEKANLVLSFHDLYPYGYSVSHINSTWVMIGNVKGERDLFIDPVVLSGSYLEVSGFSEGVECNFHTVYLYDLNGTYELEDETYYSSTQNFTLDNQVRPADSGALKLSVNMTDKDLGNGYAITFDGMDFFDSPLSETIDLDPQSAPYVWETLGSFKSVNSSGVTITIPGGRYINFSIFQPRWGLISEMGNSYFIESAIKMKEGSWFADENKTVEFQVSPAPDYEYIWLENNTHFRLGELFDPVTKTGNKGCSISITTTSVTPEDILGAHPGENPDYVIIELYDSSFYSESFRANIELIRDYGTVYNCKFQNVVLVGIDCDLNYLTFHGVTAYQQFGLGYASGNTSNIHIYNCYNAFWFYSSFIADIRDATVRNVTYILRLLNGATGQDSNLTNVDSDNWRFDFTGGFYPHVYRRYDLDITTSFLNGTVINGANVTLSYHGQGGGDIGSWLSDSQGEIPTQTLIYGYYEKGGSYGTFYDYNPYFLNITYGDYYYRGNFTHDDIGNLKIALRPPDPSEFPLGLGAGFILSLTLCLVLGLAYIRKQ